ncbi:unnamed protein product [Prunus armeniaca]
MVVKGYNQDHVFDYQEVFASVARQDTIRLIVSLAAQNSWPIFQLDVKSTFLNGTSSLIQLYRSTLKRQVSTNVHMSTLYSSSLEKENSIMADFDMTDLGKMKYYIGIEVVQTTTRFFIGQKKYAHKVLERFHMENFNPVETPTESGLKLSSDIDGERVYGKTNGAASQSCKRVFHYLTGTTDFGIFYKKNGGPILTGFTDNDYVGDLDDRRSITGHVFMIGSGAISWALKKQHVVTSSTTEAEFVSATTFACQAIWLRRILEEL